MKRNYNPKPLFEERMKELLGKDYEKYWKKIHETLPRTIRANTLKISSLELKKILEAKGWKIKQPVKGHPEIMTIDSELEPGELGRSLEHLIGYYYAQEISSMLPAVVLNPKGGETVLDLCAAPGSKTTQMAAMMKNTGTIIANDVSLGRIKILASNLERCGVTNTIITKQDGIVFCKKIKKSGIMKFDKILLDAPCSGEGNVWSVPKTLQMWNPKKIISLSRLQKALLISALDILEEDGEIVYSTCTHAPEENEEVLDEILREFDNVEIEKINIPIKVSQGLKKWKDKEYLEDIKYACRIYPHVSGTEGFFIAKLKKKK